MVLSIFYPEVCKTRRAPANIRYTRYQAPNRVSDCLSATETPTVPQTEMPTVLPNEPPTEPATESAIETPRQPSRRPSCQPSRRSRPHTDRVAGPCRRLSCRASHRPGRQSSRRPRLRVDRGGDRVAAEKKERTLFSLFFFMKQGSHWPCEGLLYYTGLGNVGQFCPLCQLPFLFSFVVLFSKALVYQNTLAIILGRKQQIYHHVKDKQKTFHLFKFS